MSPTDEMLIRIADLSAFGGGGKVAGGSSTDTIMGPGVVSGALTQAAICNASNAVKMRTKLVTEPDTHNVNLGCPELASRYIQLFKVFDGADFDPEIVASRVADRVAPPFWRQAFWPGGSANPDLGAAPAKPRRRMVR